MRRFIVAVLSGLAAGAAPALPAHAQGEVYDPAPPRGSAYVRIVNTLPSEIQMRSDFLPALRLGTAPAQRGIPYTVVENVAGRALRFEVAEGERRGQGTLSAAPGAFLTVIIHRGPGGNPAATAVSEDTDFNRARARLAFYNAMPDCPAAGVQLQPAGQAVFADVPTLQSRARSVNPVTAQVRAVCGTRTSTDFALQGLEAGNMYSIWLIPDGRGAPDAFLLRDTTAPFRR